MGIHQFIICRNAKKLDPQKKQENDMSWIPTKRTYRNDYQWITWYQTFSTFTKLVNEWTQLEWNQLFLAQALWNRMVKSIMLSLWNRGESRAIYIQQESHRLGDPISWRSCEVKSLEFSCGFVVAGWGWNPSCYSNYAMRFASPKWSLGCVETAFIWWRVNPSDIDEYAIQVASENGRGHCETALMIELIHPQLA
jgi:hypothetical protein